ncbi:MAG TPA: endolytic transglycosylase MltG [Candidatus Woesebacteria bacterium]|nr:endolytic transglycosylase MltG [Candidatus Woesebacteria bacterium]
MKKWVLFLGLILCLGVVGGFFLWGNLPVSSENQPKDFVINQGEKLTSIAARLEKSRLIRNKYVFLFYTFRLGLKQKIQSGKFRLAPNLSTAAIVQRLSHGGSTDYWLRIIDGSRVEEITPRFSKEWEGYLFPDSYLIPEYFTPNDILQVIKDNFDKKLAQAKVGATNLMSDQEIVILASLLEREGRQLETKQMIAGILLNRLKANLALQIDATVQYARDTFRNPKVYWQPLQADDINLVSPYNTYKNKGLPPGPICNPGYDSLYAAFHPTASDYLFYVTGKDGQMHYAKTYQEHLENIENYLK